jgi:Flp pilus assembly protein TadB
MVNPTNAPSPAPQELHALKLQAAEWEIAYWKEQTRKYQHQVRDGSEQIKRDRTALEAARKNLQGSIRTRNKNTIIAITTGTGAIVLDALTGNIPGAVIAATMMIGKAGYYQKQAYEKRQQAEITTHLDASHLLVHSVSTDS